MDPPEPPASALPLLEVCAQRLLPASSRAGSRHRNGSLWEHDVEGLVRTLLFVPLDDPCRGSARFANGDWSELSRVLPLAEMLLPVVTQKPDLAQWHITLCERAVEHYPAALFARQALSMVAGDQGPPAAWLGTMLPARVAALVDDLALRESPLEPALAQSMLRILDALVDLGDRRSAALQMSPLFREVRARAPEHPRTAR